MKLHPSYRFPRHRLYQALFVLVVLLLSSCGEEQLSSSESDSLPAVQATAIVAAVQEQDTTIIATSTPMPTPTTTVAPTATPQPTATNTPAPTITPSITPTPSPTPTPLHPLMIDVLRQQDYPGSELIFEETLAPGVNYDRYIVSYQSEGNKIFALLTVPQGEIPDSGWPVVMFNHGYIPPEQYRTTERYVAYVDGFARNGYIVFRSDYRGHGSSEGEATGGYGSPAYTVDVLNGISAVKTHPDADPERIGMWGHSMGGHITLRAMVVTDEIKAGVIWGGVVVSYEDLFERWRRPAGSGNTPTPDPTRTRGWWRVSLQETYGTFEDNPEFWASISPNSYVSEISGPIQLHHGTADTSVPVAFSEILYAEVLAADREAELFLYEGDDHDITYSFGTAIQRSIAFFDEHLKNSG